MSNSMKPITKVITGKTRFCYVNLIKPRAIAEGEEERYSLYLLIPKSDKRTIGDIQRAVEASLKAGQKLFMGEAPESLRNPLRDGDEERLDKSEFVHHYFIRATSKQQPGMLDKNGEDILDKTQIYSGCYGRAALRFYAYNIKGNMGCGCALLNVQKLSEGETLGRSSAREDFSDPYEEEDVLW